MVPEGTGQNRMNPDGPGRTWMDPEGPKGPRETKRTWRDPKVTGQTQTLVFPPLTV